VQKVSIDAGFTCPNVDGTVAVGGCTFCDNRSFSPSRRLPRAGIGGQIDQSIARMRLRYRNCHDFLAYFQPATNTYAPVERLRTVYEEALSHPQIVGLVIGTRPDCVPDDVLDLLQELAARPSSHVGESLRDPDLPVSDFGGPGIRQKPDAGCPSRVEKPAYVSVEFGMQTMHDRSLDWMNRGHHHDAMIDAVARSRGRGFEIGAHVILGLPGESHDDMMATARELGRLGVDAVKIHNLYCVKNTPLADQVARGEVRLMERAEYVRTVVDFIELLPPTMIVDRISGDAPPDYFIGPSWCLDKPAVKAAVLAEFARRDSYQGRALGN
jgi:radical SAM superfamily enzyme